MSVSVFLLPFLCITHFNSKMCMKFYHSDNERSCFLVVSREGLFIKKVHARIVAVVGKEGRSAGSRRWRGLYGASGAPKPPRPGQWPGAGRFSFQPLPLPPSRPLPRSMPRTAPCQ